MSTPAVHVQTLSKTYTSAFGRRAVKALVAMDLTVERGEIFGLLGPNGAGKTTLLKILLSIVQPTEGEARLFGSTVRDAGARANIGFLPENHRFPDFLTANQMLDLYGRLSGVPDDMRRRRIPELLERVGMADWGDHKIKKFSKGMMQRAGLAQALLNDPDLIFLDEPTDGVDPIGRREIRDLLIWLRDQGKTVFLNSHLLSEVERVCTRVAILNKGRLVREGTIEEMTAIDQVYELLLTPLPDTLIARMDGALTALDASPEADLHRYRLIANDRAQLNTHLDQLRQAGVELEAVQPVRRSLEEYFIEVIEDVERAP